VALARALAAAPTLLLADEPTGNLDRPSGQEVMDLLSRLCREQAQTTVLVTHNARVAAHADRVLVVADGRIVDEVRAEGRGPATDAAGFRALVQRLERHDL
jgi:putative ABC transport system ATP-binding protein